ncbi:MAG TPA: hypothetical protein VGJ21_15945, partial [Terracidiphilus sp.]
FLQNNADKEKIDAYLSDLRITTAASPNDKNLLMTLSDVYAKEQKRIADAGNLWLALDDGEVYNETDMQPAYNAPIDDADAAKLRLTPPSQFSQVKIDQYEGYKEIVKKYPRCLVIQLEDCTSTGISPTDQTFTGSLTAIIDGQGDKGVGVFFGFVQRQNQQSNSAVLGQVLYVSLPNDGNWLNIVLRTEFEGGSAGQNRVQAYSDLKCLVTDFPARLGEQIGQVQFAPQYVYGVQMNLRYSIRATD